MLVKTYSKQFMYELWKLFPGSLEISGSINKLLTGLEADHLD